VEEDLVHASLLYRALSSGFLYFQAWHRCSRACRSPPPLHLTVCCANENIMPGRGISALSHSRTRSVRCHLPNRRTQLSGGRCNIVCRFASPHRALSPAIFRRGNSGFKPKAPGRHDDGGHTVISSFIQGIKRRATGGHSHSRRSLLVLRLCTALPRLQALPRLFKQRVTSTKLLATAWRLTTNGWRWRLGRSTPRRRGSNRWTGHGLACKALRSSHAA